MPVIPAASEGVTLLGIGEFGERVVALLRTSGRWPVTLAGDMEDAFQNGSAALIAAMWRPCPAVCEQADGLAFRHRRPWLPVIMDHPHVRVGPLVAPGYGACFACFEARYAQHDGRHDITAALHAEYDRDPGSGPRGYLDHQARLAAALAGITIGDLSSVWLASRAGQVLTFNVYLSGTGLRRHPVIARSRCPRCSHPDDGAGHSAVADLLHGIAAGRGAQPVQDGQARPGETVSGQ
jgi:bacteriocin biosynthesis cyclodehydratase domain-containing protein